jgi:hypothetical protein
MQGQGFIAATSMKFAGNVTVDCARAMVTTRSSTGWRSTFSTCWPNSGSSSKKSTPRCARLISPGRGRRPPPTSPPSVSTVENAVLGLVLELGSPAGAGAR